MTAVSPETLNVDAGGRPTRVLRAGEGRPVLWLHDTFGNRWTPGHQALSLECEVFAPSLPGFDDSTMLAGIDGPEDVAFWLLDLLDALGLANPLLIGCGLGGWMAAELAVRHPRLLGGLVLVGAYGLKVEGALPEDEFALTRPMLRPLLFCDPNDSVARDWLPDVEPGDRVESVLHARVAAARLAWQFPYSPKLRARLGRARVRSLIVWGELDGLVPFAHARAYRDGLPDARVVSFPNAAHYPYLEAPERFAEEIASFARTMFPLLREAAAD